MPEIDDQEAGQDMSQEEPPAPSREGYRICIDVLADGFAVSQEELPASPADADAQQAETVPDLTTAIKHVLSIIKDNPIDQSEQAGFKSATSGMA